MLRQCSAHRSYFLPCPRCRRLRNWRWRLFNVRLIIIQRLSVRMEYIDKLSVEIKRNSNDNKKILGSAASILKLL